MIHTNSTFDGVSFKLLVFDLDGTLVNAFEDIWIGINTVMRAHGLPELPFEVVKNHVGEGARMLVRRCLGDLHASYYPQIYQAYRNYYAENPVQRAHPYPGVLATLDRLRAMGYRLAILTNKPDEVTRRACEKLGLASRVEGIWGERHDIPRKPHPDSLLQVVSFFGCQPTECAMVGDGPADHAVAQAAGVKMIAVTWGLLSREQTLEQRPAAMIDSMPELLDLLRPNGNFAND